MIPTPTNTPVDSNLTVYSLNNPYGLARVTNIRLSGEERNPDGSRRGSRDIKMPSGSGTQWELL